MYNIANVSNGNKVAQFEWEEETTADKKITKVATSGKINFKGLTPNQIEVRPTGTTPKGQCTLLLYIDSRCASNILGRSGERRGLRRRAGKVRRRGTGAAAS